MATTMQEKFEAALADRGEKLVKVTARYRVWTRTSSLGDNKRRPEGAPEMFYYLGTNGAVRIGQTVADSRPLVETMKLILRQAGETALAKKR